jgi:hypothetical protein
MLKMKSSGKLLVLAAFGLTAVACVTTEKSENPLSPTVAGPIAGVNITQPQPVEPVQGIRIANGQQPLTLSLQNAASTGVRPISYLYQIATDAEFANIVFSREGVTPGTNGVTSLRLPDALASDRAYYWRVRAQDGANTGPFSHSMTFTLFTPVVIGKPIAILPAYTASELAPLFQVGNAPRSGPATAIVYNIEVSQNLSFAPYLASWVVSEQPGAQTTLRSPQNLPAGSVIFWRVMAFDSTASSPWSDIGSFTTPAPTPTTPTPTTPGGSCSSRGNPQSILECQRNQYPAHMSHEQLVTFLRASARDINRSGSAGGPWGLLVKTSGANCNGYSCDILCMGNGSGQVQRDVLLDSEGSQVPFWGGPIDPAVMAVRTCEPQP